MGDNALVMQAILCGIFAYLSAQGTPWFLGSQTGSFYLLSRPLVAGLVVGLIMGDVYKGILIGAAVQTVFLSSVGIGGTVSADLPFASYIGIPIAMGAQGTGEVEAIALASTVAVLGIFVHNIMSSVNIFWMHRGQSDLENGNFGRFFTSSFLLSAITTFLLRFTPAFLAVWLGSAGVNRLIANLPETALHALGVLGGLLPALGIAILMRQTIKQNIMFIYFLTGFMFVAVLGVNMIALSIIGALFAYFHFNYSGTKVSEGSDNSPNQNTQDEEDDEL